MTNWQFITILCTIVGGFGIVELVVIVRMRSLRRAINEQIAACRNEQRLARLEADIRRLEAENREIKHDLRQVFRPVLPG